MKLASLLVLVCTSSLLACPAPAPPPLPPPAPPQSPPPAKPPVVAIEPPPPPRPIDGDAPELDANQRDVLSLVGALYNGQVETILRLTHPAIIEKMGGPDAARDAIAKGVKRVADAGMKHESLAFPKPPEHFQAGSRQFVVVPTLSIAISNGERVESLNYQLGVREGEGLPWTYVDGSRITKQNLQTFFPGFPADHELPETYRKKLE